MPRSVLDQFAKNLISSEQPEIIMTSEMEKGLAYFNALQEKQRNGTARIGMILGNSGTGKTMLAYHLVKQAPIISYTGLPNILYFEQKPRISGLALLQDMMVFLGEDPKERSQFRLIDPVIELLVDLKIETILLDESNWISDEVFETVLRFHNRTNILPIMFGTPALLKDIVGKPTFESRVWKPQTISPLSDDEINSTYLPNLRIPRWHFDPVADKRLGTKIWSKVKPNLRKLQCFLDDARLAAEALRDTWITEKHIDIVIKTPGQLFNEPERKKGGEDASQEEKGPYEQESEERYKAKKGKNVKA